MSAIIEKFWGDSSIFNNFAELDSLPFSKPQTVDTTPNSDTEWDWLDDISIEVDESLLSLSILEVNIDEMEPMSNLSSPAINRYRNSPSTDRTIVSTNSAFSPVKPRENKQLDKPEAI